MKSHTLELPAAGATVYLILPAGATSASVTITAPEEVIVRMVGPAPPQTKTPVVASADGVDLDFVLKRLLKLKPNKRATAINSIKSMFQFEAPITDEAAAEILEALRKRGALTMDEIGRVKYKGI